MKKTLFLYTFLFSFFLKASYDCMDNSHHLKEPYDNKSYRKVLCNCPCKKYKIYEDRGRCSKCKHFRDPKKERWEL